jgi:hypothetical protein
MKTFKDIFQNGVADDLVSIVVIFTTAWQLSVLNDGITPSILSEK